MVMVGPCSRSVTTANQMAIPPATNGTNQTTERPRLLRMAACGARSGSTGPVSGGVVMSGISCVPDEPWIKGHGREHGEDHHRGEGYGSDARFKGSDRAKIDQGHEDRDHENVHHRPAADRLDNPIHDRAVTTAVRGPTVHGKEQVGEADDLQHRYGDAGEEDQECNRPHSDRYHSLY